MGCEIHQGIDRWPKQRIRLEGCPDGRIYLVDTPSILRDVEDPEGIGSLCVDGLFVHLILNYSAVGQEVFQHWLENVLAKNIYRIIRRSRFELV